MRPPVVTTTAVEWGAITSILWGSGDVDVIMFRDASASASMVATYDGVNWSSGAPSAALTFDTDALVGVFRMTGGLLSHYMLVEGTRFDFNAVRQLTILDAPATVTCSLGIVRLDRGDANFAILANGVSDVRYRDIHIPTIDVAGYLTPSLVSNVGSGAPPSRLDVRAYPNPFNPTVSVDIVLTRAARVEAEIYDVRGRKVDTLWSGELAAGTHTLHWTASNDRGSGASGIYFLSVRTPELTRTVKLTVVK